MVFDLGLVLDRDSVTHKAGPDDGQELTAPLDSQSAGYPIVPGAELYYQTRCRDSNPRYCPAPQGNTWNASNGAVIRW